MPLSPCIRALSPRIPQDPDIVPQTLSDGLRGGTLKRCGYSMIVRVQKSLLYKSVLYCRNCASEWMFDEPARYLETQMHTQCYETRVTSVLLTTPRNSHWSTQNIEFEIATDCGGRPVFFSEKKGFVIEYPHHFKASGWSQDTNGLVEAMKTNCKFLSLG